MRKTSSSNFIYGQTYEYLVGNTPEGVNCLEDCKFEKYANYSTLLSRGDGHSKVGVTKKRINGMYEMGTNVWEWANIENKRTKASKGRS